MATLSYERPWLTLEPVFSGVLDLSMDREQAAFENFFTFGQRWEVARRQVGAIHVWLRTSQQKHCNKFMRYGATKFE